MNKAESKNPKNKKKKKELLYTLMMPGDFPEALMPLIDKAAGEIEGTAEERSKIMQFMADILYAGIKAGQLDDMGTFFLRLVPLGKYELTSKDHAAYLEAVRLVMETVADAVPASFLVPFIKKNIISSLKKENEDLLTEVKSLGKKEMYSPDSIPEMKALMVLIQEFMGRALADEGSEVTASKKERSERISKITRLHALSLALYTIAQINELMSKGDFSKDQAICVKYLMLGVFLGEAMNPLHLFHRQIQESFFSMGASDALTEKRWAPLNKLKEDAMEIADNLWSDEEENIMHHEMAAEIYESLRQSHAELRSKYIEQKVSSKKCKGKNAEERRVAAEQLTDKFLIKTIRDAIVPVAEKWESKKGCILVWGKKGAKTEK